jgi:hypothetical protein
MGWKEKNNMIAHLWLRQSLSPWKHRNFFNFALLEEQEEGRKELKPDKLAMGFRRFRLYSF